MCMCGGSKKFPESAIERLFWYKHVLKLMHMRGVQKVHEKCTLWKIWISNIFCTKINPSLSSIFWCISWRPTISVSRDKSGMYFSNTGCSVIQGFFFFNQHVWIPHALSHSMQPWQVWCALRRNSDQHISGVTVDWRFLKEFIMKASLGLPPISPLTSLVVQRSVERSPKVGAFCVSHSTPKAVYTAEFKSEAWERRIGKVRSHRGHSTKNLMERKNVSDPDNLWRLAMQKK